MILLGSLLLGLACVVYMRSWDVHEPEPWPSLLATTVLGGCVSIVAIVFLLGFIDGLGLGDMRQQGLNPIPLIGLPEETAKLAGFLACYPIFRRHLNEPMDAVLYMSCVALGFSAIENWDYATRADAPGIVLMARYLMATPGHIAFSAFMGLGFYGIRLGKPGGPIVLLGAPLLLGSVAHGIWDIVAFNHIGLPGPLASICILAMPLLAFRLLRTIGGTAHAVSPHRRTLKAFIEQYPDPHRSRGIECLYCGDHEDKVTYAYGKITIQKCDGCGHHVTTHDSLYYIFHHFGSDFRNLTTYLRRGAHENANLPPDGADCLYQGNYLSVNRQLACFDLEDLDAAVEEFNAMITTSLLARFMR